MTSWSGLRKFGGVMSSRFAFFLMAWIAYCLVGFASCYFLDWRHGLFVILSLNAATTLIALLALFRPYENNTSRSNSAACKSDADCSVPCATNSASSKT
jgi:hypothetical protein